MEKHKVLLTHPGTQHAFRLAIELEAHGSLSRLATGCAIAERSIIGKAIRLMPSSITRLFSRRRVPLLPSCKVRSFPSLELAALWRLRRGAQSGEVLHRRNAAFQEKIPDEWIQDASHVIGFDTSSWLLASRCMAFGRPFILDQTTAHARTKERITEELRNRFPEWANTIPEKPEEHLQCEDLEHSAASVITVPSTFVADTLVKNGVCKAKIRIIPFGVDLDLFYPSNTDISLPLIFLYAGTLSAGKGVPILLDAWKEARLHPRAELWLIGPGTLPWSTKLPQGIRLLGTLSRTDLAHAMRCAHVFVFPSFFEGLALVQLEALASGLPVIGTRSSGATDIVEPGETGLILTSGSVNELSDCLGQMTDIDKVRKMRNHCIQTRGGRSWQTYAERWMQLLNSIAPNNVDSKAYQ